MREPGEELAAGRQRCWQQVLATALAIAACLALSVPIAKGAIRAWPVGLRAAIIGGQPAPPGSFPMMAFVYSDLGYFCSGTVIAPNVVLTAGHCGVDSFAPSHLHVITGSPDWTDSATRQLSPVSKVIPYPGYGSATPAGSASPALDAALLVLMTPTSAPPVRLAADPGDLPLLNPGTEAALVGWGATATAAVSPQLQWGRTVVQGSPYCAQQAMLDSTPFDAASGLCTIDAPSESIGTCGGDSGGPLLAQHPDGTWIDLGVAVRGPTNCVPSQPDFFTRADAIYSWAQSWINAVRPQPAPLAGAYRGQTSEGWPITLRVTTSSRALTVLGFGFGLKCTSHRSLIYSFRSASRDPGSWRLSEAAGFGFSRRFGDMIGRRFQISGRFTAHGTASGTLSVSWHSSQDGACTSGPIHWHATLSTAP